jgi:hypothetical protein
VVGEVAVGQPRPPEVPLKDLGWRWVSAWMTRSDRARHSRRVGAAIQVQLSFAETERTPCYLATRFPSGFWLDASELRKVAGVRTRCLLGRGASPKQCSDADLAIGRFHGVRRMIEGLAKTGPVALAKPRLGPSSPCDRAYKQARRCGAYLPGQAERALSWSYALRTVPLP